jgi:hypothetical protein
MARRRRRHQSEAGNEFARAILALAALGLLWLAIQSGLVGMVTHAIMAPIGESAIEGMNEIKAKQTAERAQRPNPK